METKTQHRRPLAAVYCRVSTEEQAKEGLSIETQAKQCTQAAEKDGFKVVHVLRDEGRSGKDMNRPAMRELISFITKEDIDAVYAIHNDRIGRNTRDYLTFRDLLRKHSVSLHCLLQPMLDDDSPTSRTMDTIMASFNEMQRLVTADKVIGVLKEIAEAGFLPTNPPPGYIKVKNPDLSVGRIGRHIVVPDPVMGPLVTELFHTYARGGTNVNELADLMYEKGLRNKKGDKVTAYRIYPILRNRTYLGELHWRDVDIKRARHEPLIDETTYNAVQLVLNIKNQRACRRRKYEWLLAGLLTCPRHERRYTAEWHLGKKVAYYHCSYPGGCGKYVEKGEMETMVAEKFRDLEFSDEFISLVVEKARTIFNERRRTYEARRQSEVNHRTALELRRKQAEDKLFGGVLSDMDFTRIRNGIQEELEKIETNLAELENQRSANVDIAQEVLSLTRSIGYAYRKASVKLQRRYLHFFWDHFEVLDGVILKATPTPLFAALLDLEQAVYRHPKNSERQRNAENQGLILSDIQCG